MPSRIKHLRGLLTYVSSERVQYKPYGYALDFSQGGNDGKKVYVEVDVPESSVIEETPDSIIISLNGLAVLLETTASVIDTMHDVYMRRATGRA